MATVLPGGCTLYPEQQQVIAKPARVEYVDHFGWNSGANSAAILRGEVRVAFEAPALSTGIVVGLTRDRTNVTRYARMDYAFYFHQTGGKPRYRLMEQGVAKSEPADYAPGSPCEIRREGGEVVYLVAGEEVRRVATVHAGDISVGIALYGTGDSLA